MIDVSIEKLEELTMKLPPVPRLGDFKKVMRDFKNDIEKVTYDIKNGDCFSYRLFTAPSISIARTFTSKGGEFPIHRHDEKEYLLVYSGSIKITIGKEERILNIGDFLFIDKDTPHKAKALEDTWFIAITIPYSKDFPEDE